MANELFVLTDKDLTKLLVMIVLAAVFFGLSGVLMIIFFHWVARRSYAADTIDKHGISEVTASRLGGVSVFLSSFALLVFAAYSGVLGREIGVFEFQLFCWIGTLSCAFLGLVEDFYNGRLSPTYRLFSKLIIFGLILAIWPSLIPSDLGVPVINFLLALPLLGWALTVIFCVGFINAVNMADGANGLMPGILSISFVLFYLETGGLVYATLLTSCCLFAIFNIISGRLFLGDTGTYGFGAALTLSGLYLSSENFFSPAFLAVLFAYPCIDFLVSVFRRIWQGRSVLLPDNDHLHNRVYFHCQRWFGSKAMANSVTGCGISISFSGLALIGYLADWWPVVSDQWIWLFLIQCGSYGLAFFLFGLNRPQAQYALSR